MSKCSYKIYSLIKPRSRRLDGFLLCLRFIFKPRSRRLGGFLLCLRNFRNFFCFVGEQTQTSTRPLLSPDDVIISQLQVISQLFSLYPPPPPTQEHFVKLANELFRQNMAVCEKCLFGQNWAKLRWRCTSGRLQG